MDYEQLSIFDIRQPDWKEEVSALCERLIAKLELPEGSLYLAENRGKTGEIISYSLCIYEPEYPLVSKVIDATRNTVVINIKQRHFKKAGDRIEFQVKENTIDFVPMPLSVEDKGIINDRWHKYQFQFSDINLILDSWLSYIEQLTEYSVRIYESKATPFACCSRFTECSDAKHCVHENKLYACACMYKTNLDQGRIFYGKNKNA